MSPFLDRGGSRCAEPRFWVSVQRPLCQSGRVVRLTLTGRFCGPGCKNPLTVEGAAPATVQTVLTTGNYVALNITGSGQPGFAPFTVTQSPWPAALPPAAATQTTIEFGFQGPTVLHNESVVRARTTAGSCT